ncbi:MAG: HupE/UreJ family protein [Parvibaculales bacterium]
MVWPARFGALVLSAMAFFLPAGVAVKPAQAHEVRPGHIGITETARDRFEIIWKQPVRDLGPGQVAGLGLRPVFPENCVRQGDSNMQRRPGLLVERFRLTCAGGLMGRDMGVEGLQRTITDVFVDLRALDGAQAGMRLTAEQPVQKIAGGGAHLRAYFGLGVEHLIFGFDHILFVLGLVMLVRDMRRLVYVITAFTLAHSLTLALSMLGNVSAPSSVVEAIIALSILFLAVELSLPEEKRSPLATRFPQAVAFGFGLLHGFGFAGVLGDIGLPRDLALPALALFNIGLEAGQLLVVALALVAGHYLAPITDERPLIAEAPILLIGGISVYWLVERSLAIMPG